MIQLGQAIFYLKGDKSNLTQTLDSAEKDTQSASGKIKGFLGNAFSFAVGGLIQKGIEGITGSFGGLVSGMIGGNAQFETYNAQFKTLLGSAGAAKARMAELAEFGAKTPFELPEVVEADRVLQGFGLHSEEAAKKFGFSGKEIRTIAGDVASGTGAGFKEMTLLLGKFSAGATGEAITRMAELGITNRAELAKMGLDFSKSGELLSPLPEAMNTVLKLMKDKYGGLMAEQSTTFDGMVSNLVDWKASTLRTIGAPIFEVLKGRLSDLLTFLSDPGTMAVIDGFAQSLAAGISTTISFISDTVIPLFIDGWTSLQAPIQAVSAVFETLGGSFSVVGTEGGVLNTYLSNFPSILQPVLTILGNYINVWRDVYDTIVNVASALGQGNVQGAFDALVGGLKQTASDYGVYAGSIRDALLGIGQYLLDNLPVWGQALISWVEPAIPPLLEKLGSLGNQALAWISGQATALFTSFQVWATATWEWIPGATVTFLAQWPGFLNSFLDWIGSAAGPLLAKLGTWAMQFIAWIAPQIPGFLIALGGLALAILVFVGETALVLGTKLIEWGLAFLGWVGKEVLPKLPGILKSVQDSIGSWISSAVGWIAGQAASIGSNLVAGIRQGFADQWDSFLGWVNRQIDKIPKVVRDALGIASPSRVMYDFGAPIIGGLVNGIVAALPELLQTMRNVTDSVVSKFEDLASKAKSLMAGIFGGQASFFRTEADNIRDLAKIGSDGKELKNLQQEQADLEAKIKPNNYRLINAKGALDADPTDPRRIEEMNAALREQQKIQARLGEIEGEKVAAIEKQNTLNDLAKKTADELNKANQESLKFQDPRQAADYMKLRSKEIFDLAQLQQQLIEAGGETTDEGRRIQQRIELEQRAQEAERAQFAASQTDQLDAFRKALYDFLNQTNEAGSGSPAYAQIAAALNTLNQLLAGGSMSDYNLTINTSAPYEPIIQDFSLMRASAQGRS